LQVNEEIAVSTDSTHYVQFEGDDNFKLYPAWWGAVGDNTTDDFTAFSASANSEGVHQIVRGYKLVGTVAPMLILDRVHLVDSGFINNEIAVLTVNACTSTEGAYNNFRAVSGDFANYVFNFVGFAKWFFDTTCSDVQLSTLRTALTSKNLIWDRPVEYTLSPLIDNQEYFVNQVKFGTLLNFDAGVNIGLVDAGQYRIFADGSKAPSYLNEKVLGAWFGVSKFSTNAVNEEGIKNAIVSSENGTVDFGGGKVQIGASVVIPANTDNVTIKNLFVEVNGASVPALTFTDSSISILDSTIEGVETDSTCNISLNNCKVAFSDSSQDLVLLGENISVKDCEIGASNWVGSTQLGSVATKATIESVIYTGNVSTSGRFNFTTGTSTNAISDNTFNELLRIGVGTEDQNYITINGGSYSSICDNTISVIDDAGVVASNNILSFLGSGEMVQGLSCIGNSFNLTEVTTEGGYTEIYASGYANTGHEAKVFDNVSSSNLGVVNSTRKYESGASATTGAVEYTIFGFLFPFTDIASSPFFSGTTWAVGNSTSATPSYFAGEIISYVPSGGQAEIRIKYRAFNGASVNLMGITLSVENTNN